MPLVLNNCTSLLNVKCAFDNFLDANSAINNPIALTVPANSAPTVWTSGTGANQVNKVWSDTRTLAASAKTYDLAAEAAASTNTGAASFSAVKILAITNNGTNALTLFNAASTSFQGPLSAAATYTLNGGETLLLVNGTAGGWVCSTNKSLKIDPGANSVSVTLTVLGN